jgi:peptide/nickel transport system permease protein
MRVISLGCCAAEPFPVLLRLLREHFDSAMITPLGAIFLVVLLLLVAVLLYVVIGGSASLRNFVFTRVLLTLPMVFILLTLIFFVLRVIPGDPISSQLGPRGSAQLKDQLRAELGLNQPILIQYFNYLSKIAQLDLGHSMVEAQRPIIDELSERLPATLELIIPSFLMMLLISVLPGALAAHRHRKVIDYVLRMWSIVTYSMPIFWLGLLLQLFFSVQLGWLPLDHRLDPVLEAQLAQQVATLPFHTNMTLIDSALVGNWAAFGNVLLHLILPVLTLSLVLSGVFLRLTRVNMIETLQQDFITAARARGVPQRTVVYRHALRNAFIPVLTLLGLQLAALFAGAVLTETTFSWPGMGLYLFARITQRDYTAVQGVVTVFAVLVATTSLLVDVLYAFVDPRIRY